MAHCIGRSFVKRGSQYVGPPQIDISLDLPDEPNVYDAFLGLGEYLSLLEDFHY